MYLYKVSYLGWLFFGSQIQSDQITVEGELTKLMGTRAKFLSRTDRGVSARANTLVVDTKLNIGKINSQIEGVKIWAESKVLKVPKIKHRHYRYFLNEFLGDPKNLLKFNGTHDFSKFARIDGSSKVKKDTLRSVEVKLGKRGDFDFVDFYSKGFLWNQVRRMVGHEKNKTASPLPLILMDIIFENEPTWIIHEKWLDHFRNDFLESYAKFQVLNSLRV
ncbi:MAG: hypothetical protein GOU98_03315 [Candidatus Altiarchaeota archaeon]|nr:hypothetical protein [Candidatus Altiarchaeota archaeon]